jgi:hypothetical protein
MRQIQPRLAEPQARELIQLFIVRFAEHRNELETILRYAVGREIQDITQAGPERPFERTVSDLLNWANQQGRGPMEALLHVATGARPKDAELQTFCSTYAPSALQPPNVIGRNFEVTQALNSIGEVTEALKTLAKMARVSIKVVNLRTIYRTDMQVTLQQLRLVEQYKGLHNILHDIQQKMDEIEARLSAKPSDEEANRFLQRYARGINESAEDAEQYLPGLKTAAVEQIWINGLKTNSDDMRAVAQSNADPFDRGQVNISLRSLINQAAVSVNGGLAEAAGDLRLDSIIDMIDAVIAQAALAQNDLQLLSQGAAAIGALRVTVGGMVAEHAAWQVVSTKLETAKGTIQYQPEKKIKDWPTFEKQVRALCGLYPEEPWSKRTMQRLDDWVAATQKASPTKEEKTNSAEALRSFAGSCGERFYRVDTLVKAITDNIVQLTQPLTNFLTAAGPSPQSAPSPTS